jgi:hypothetical protein
LPGRFVQVFGRDELLSYLPGAEENEPAPGGFYESQGTYSPYTPMSDPQPAADDNGGYVCPVCDAPVGRGASGKLYDPGGVPHRCPLPPRAAAPAARLADEDRPAGVDPWADEDPDGGDFPERDFPERRRGPDDHAPKGQLPTQEPASQLEREHTE